MYTTRNFKTKKELKEAVQRSLDTLSEPVTLYAPGLGTPARDGEETVEGPHYPEPHRWYATVVMKNGMVVAVR